MDYFLNETFDRIGKKKKIVIVIFNEIKGLKVKFLI